MTLVVASSLPGLWPALHPGTAAAAPTPACGAHDHPTPPQTEGPFFKPESPQRESLLEPQDKGPVLVLSGRVVDTRCQPVGGVLLDFWHADRGGRYDNQGFRMRGHVFADASGRFRMETSLPGLYPGRTRHLHVRVQPAGGRVLTTQLYFPGEAGNRRDGLFDDALLMTVTRHGDRLDGRFDFVLERT
jgi:protocatechuate 3,4-dioxygenase beta subunit